MDSTAKLAFGKLLGELYRLHRITGQPNPASDGRIFGLRNGIEDAVDAELSGANFLGNKTYQGVLLSLAKYEHSKKDPEAQVDYQDFQEELSRNHVGPSDALLVLKYLFAEGEHASTISELGSQHGSPYQGYSLTGLDD